MKLSDYLTERFQGYDPSEAEAHQAIVDWAKQERTAEMRRKAAAQYLDEHPDHPYVW